MKTATRVIFREFSPAIRYVGYAEKKYNNDDKKKMLVRPGEGTQYKRECKTKAFTVSIQVIYRVEIS